MIDRPAIAPRFRAEIQEDKVLLSSDAEYIVLEGKLCASLVPRLNGEDSAEEIIKVLSQHYPAPELYFTLMQMESDGFLIEGGPQQASSLPNLLHQLGKSADTLVNNALPDVRLFAVGFDEADQLEETFADFHITTAPEARHWVVVTSDYLHSELESINAEALEKEANLFLVKPVGPTCWFGPAIMPSETGCWACLKHRLELNQPAHVFLTEQAQSVVSGSAPQTPKPLLQLGLHLASVEVTKWLSGGYPNDQLISFDVQSLETRSHTFIRRPQCPTCGKPDLYRKGKQAISLVSTKTSADTLYRIRAAQDTIDHLEHHISPITGIVRKLSRVESDAKALIHTYTVNHGNRHRGHSLESLRTGTRDQSGGKGRTNVQARASGLCEALERYSAMFDDEDASDKSASYNSISGTAFHPASLLLFSESQYQERDRWNGNQMGHFQFVPEPFDENVDIEWTKIWSLTHNEARYVPTAYCYFGFDGAGKQFCKADSNGLASGNCLEEAILQAIYELVERDAVSIWWYNRIRYPKVDFASFRDPYVNAIQKYYASLDRDLWVIDITHDLGIPSFVAISPQRDSDTEDILLGFGTHFDARIAISRAILEVNQSLPTVSRPREEIEKQLLPDFADALNWWNTARTSKESYLIPSDAPVKTADDYLSYGTVDLKERIESFTNKAKSLGLETLVLDLSKPDIDLAAARVIVPGLRHFWRRLAPGRLYDVPVEMQTIERKNHEDLLNPIALFL